MVAICKPQCGKGKICVKGYRKKSGTYVKPHCSPDKGAKGKTSSSKKWAPKEMKFQFAPLLPEKKMPFNRPLKVQTSVCRVAGQKMKKMGTPYATAIQRAIFPYNISVRLASKNAAPWKQQRNACLDGIRSAYKK